MPQPVMPDPLPPQPELDQIIEGAARRGARMALAELGLDDSQAPRDLRDLRHLLVSWRRIRREAINAVVGFSVRAILFFMVAVSALMLWFGEVR